MLLETILRHLLHLYLQTTADKHPLLLNTLMRIPHFSPTPPLSMRAIVSPILPNKLYLSGLTAASTPDTLRAHRITHVLSLVSADEAPALPPDITHLVIPVRDTTTTNLLQHLPAAVAFIATPDARVLVHCVEGVSRSAAVVVAYLMSERAMGFAQALRVVKHRRNVVCPNLGFVRQLSEWGGECEARRREEPTEWEQVLERKKAPPPPVTVERVVKKKAPWWREWLFSGEQAGG